MALNTDLDLRRSPNQFNLQKLQEVPFELKEQVASPSGLICRICYEKEIVGNTLIHPCKCTGSVKFIHEECLKTWLVSQECELDKCECELCKTPFKMNFSIVTECSASKGCKESTAICVFVPLLCVVVAMMSGIIFVLAEFYLSKASTTEEKGYAAALIFVCVFAALVLFGLVVHASKESCLFNTLSTWEILNMESEIDDSSRFEDLSKDRSFVEHPLVPGITHAEGVFVLPAKIKIGKYTVQTPSLTPNLALLSAEGNRIVYAPPQMARSLNITPVRSRFVSVEPTVVRCTSFPTLATNKVLPSFQIETTTKRCEDE